MDISGRTVWSKSIKDESVLGGSREFLWNGTSNGGERAGEGLYIIRMTSFDANGKLKGSFYHRIMVLR